MDDGIILAARFFVTETAKFIEEFAQQNTHQLKYTSQTMASQYNQKIWSENYRSAYGWG